MLERVLQWIKEQGEEFFFFFFLNAGGGWCRYAKFGAYVELTIEITTVIC